MTEPPDAELPSNTALTCGDVATFTPEIQTRELLRSDLTEYIGLLVAEYGSDKSAVIEARLRLEQKFRGARYVGAYAEGRLVGGHAIFQRRLSIGVAQRSAAGFGGGIVKAGYRGRSIYLRLISESLRLAQVEGSEYFVGFSHRASDYLAVLPGVVIPAAEYSVEIGTLDSRVLRRRGLRVTRMRQLKDLATIYAPTCPSLRSTVTRAQKDWHIYEKVLAKEGVNGLMLLRKSHAVGYILWRAGPRSARVWEIAAVPGSGLAVALGLQWIQRQISGQLRLTLSLRQGGMLDDIRAVLRLTDVTLPILFGRVDGADASELHFRDLLFWRGDYF